MWPDSPVELNWTPRPRLTVTEAAAEASVSVNAMYRFRAGRRVRRDPEVAAALATYEDQIVSSAHRLPAKKRVAIRLPALVDERLGAFLGYLIGDGHISRVGRVVGLTTGDDAQADAFCALAGELFGLVSRKRRDGNRWRIDLYAEALSDFLEGALGLTSGPSAREKRIPDAILRSPEPVVRAFLRAYFDCDGYAGEQGVILSTSSDSLSEQVQLVILNYGILSRRRRQAGGCWHVHVQGASAARFADRVGFGLERKQRALEAFVAGHRWFKEERWEDEVVSIEHGRADVYDISVADSHRYAAAGLINHNSYWHSTLMTQTLLNPDELIACPTQPYKDDCHWYPSS